MEPTTTQRETASGATTVNVEDLKDRPLNYYSDQLPDIKPNLRKLDLELVLNAVADNLAVISSAALLGGTVTFLLKRRYSLASCCALGLLLQQALTGGTGEFPRPARINGKSRKELELERYALKAQRGDYGPLEVIAFK